MDMEQHCDVESVEERAVVKQQSEQDDISHSLDQPAHLCCSSVKPAAIQCTPDRVVNAVDFVSDKKSSRSSRTAKRRTKDDDLIAAVNEQTGQIASLANSVSAMANILRQAMCNDDTVEKKQKVEEST